MKWEYLFFNVVILASSSLGAALYPGKRWPVFKPALLAILAVSGPYLIWDQLVTNDWWWFNEQFTLGLKIGRLPIEEVLFFIVIPWSCLVIWENLKLLIDKTLLQPIEQGVMTMAGVVAFWSAIEQRWYPLAVAVVVSLVSGLSLMTEKWLRRQSALAFLSLVIGLTLIFNGYLTARPVVLYNPLTMSNIRLITIPIEDIFYGLALVCGVVMLYEHLLTLTKRR